MGAGAWDGRQANIQRHVQKRPSNNGTRDGGRVGRTVITQPLRIDTGRITIIILKRLILLLFLTIVVSKQLRYLGSCMLVCLFGLKTRRKMCWPLCTCFVLRDVCVTWYNNKIIRILDLHPPPTLLSHPATRNGRIYSNVWTMQPTPMCMGWFPLGPGAKQGAQRTRRDERRLNAPKAL